MTRRSPRGSVGLIVAGAIFSVFSAWSRADDPLPSWNNAASKASIVSFVERIIQEGSDSFVPPAERIAVFDQDGTLWSEKPFYFQLAFAIDRVKELAPKHPEWNTTQPFQAVIEGDHDALLAAGQHGLLELVMATHAGITTDEFAQAVMQWTTTARHPRFQRPYTELVFQPMLELLAYLRAHGFTTYIVSGGGIEFIRVFAEDVYQIPPQQVIGSTIETEFVLRDDRPVLVRLPKIDFIDDRAGKPVAIHRFIGRRPIMAFGNSDGDYEMLRYVTSGNGPSLAAIVHHTDAEREFAYDRDSKVGKLDRALTEAPERGWTIIDMRRDWKSIYPEESNAARR